MIWGIIVPVLGTAGADWFNPEGKIQRVIGFSKKETFKLQHAVIQSITSAAKRINASTLRHLKQKLSVL